MLRSQWPPLGAPPVTADGFDVWISLVLLLSCNFFFSWFVMTNYFLADSYQSDQGGPAFTSCPLHSFRISLPYLFFQYKYGHRMQIYFPKITTKSLWLTIEMNSATYYGTFKGWGDNTGGRQRQTPFYHQVVLSKKTARCGEHQQPTHWKTQLNTGGSHTHAGTRTHTRVWTA